MKKIVSLFLVIILIIAGYFAYTYCSKNWDKWFNSKNDEIVQPGTDTPETDTPGTPDTPETDAPEIFIKENVIESFLTPETVACAYYYNTQTEYNAETGEGNVIYKKDLFGQYLDANNNVVNEDGYIIDNEGKVTTVKSSRVVERYVNVNSKYTQNPSAQWHSNVTDNNNETRKGVISCQAIDTYFNNFYIRSSIRTQKFYKKGPLNVVDDPSWDFISVWLMIDGPEGETTTIYRNMTYYPEQVPNNTWYELKITKQHYANHPYKEGEANYSIYPYYDFSYDRDTNPMPLISLGNAPVNKDVTIYFDQISYEKELNINVDNDTTNGTCTITADIPGIEDYKISYEVQDMLGNTLYTYNYFNVTESADYKVIVTCDYTYTYINNEGKTAVASNTITKSKVFTLTKDE